MDSLGNIWKHIYSAPRNRSALWLLIIVRYTNTLTYLLTATTVNGQQIQLTEHGTSWDFYWCSQMLFNWLWPISINETYHEVNLYDNAQQSSPRHTVLVHMLQCEK